MGASWELPGAILGPSWGLSPPAQALAGAAPPGPAHPPPPPAPHPGGRDRRCLPWGPWYIAE
eukprot:1527401-Pyramimonas_sp.AAC.1